MSTKRKLTISVLIALTTFGSANARAGVLSDALDSMIDLTDRSVLNGFMPLSDATQYFDSGSVLDGNDITNRLGYIGPTYRLRTPVKDFELFSFSPPSLSYGCGGIDMTLGAFSMVSLDELVALLRAIPSNALSYGFGQAIHALCPPCWAGMRDVQQQIEDWNKSMKNSCELAKMIVDDVGRNLEDTKINRCGTKSGAGVMDYASCLFGDESQKTDAENNHDSATSNAALGGSTSKTEYLQKGNYLWDMVRGASNQTAVINGNDQFEGQIHQFILGIGADIPLANVLSTFFSTSPGMEFKDAADSETKQNPNKSSVTPDTFISLLTSPENRIKIYTCEDKSFLKVDGSSIDVPDPMTECIWSTEADPTDEEGFDLRIRRKFSDAIERLIAADFANLTDEEKAVIILLPSELSEALRLSNTNQRKRLSSAIETMSSNLTNMIAGKFLEALVDITRRNMTAFMKNKSGGGVNVEMLETQMAAYAKLADKLTKESAKKLNELNKDQEWVKLRDQFSDSISLQIMKLQGVGMSPGRG